MRNDVFATLLMMLTFGQMMFVSLRTQIKKSKSFDLDFLSIEDEKTAKPVISPSAKPNRILRASAQNSI